jgi:hypothetical protein
MRRLLNPRLLIVLGVGMGLLSLLVAQCVNTAGRGNTYTRDGVICIGGIEDLQLFGIPYSWILGASICLVLFSVYLFLEERHRKISN